MLKLKEVLWEITPKCNRDCSFCGSSGIVEHINTYPQNNTKQLPISQLQEIAAGFADYEVETVTLTGGEPGMLSPKEFDLVLSEMHEYVKYIKVVSNGYILEQPKHNLERISQIGISVNDQQDIDYLKKFGIDILRNITFITNFGKHNTFDFDLIREYVSNTCASIWQVQLTMGKDLQLNLDGIKFLKDKIKWAQNDMTNSGQALIEADNLQNCHKCRAGINSCGVLYNGDVVACLSGRCFEKDGFAILRYGNLFERNIREIWETEFREIRFNGDESHVCRKHLPIDVYANSCPIGEIELPKFKNPIQMVYGVFGPKTIEPYSPPDDDGGSTFVYGVSSIKPPFFDGTK